MKPLCPVTNTRTFALPESRPPWWHHASASRYGLFDLCHRARSGVTIVSSRRRERSHGLQRGEWSIRLSLGRPKDDDAGPPDTSRRDLPVLRRSIEQHGRRFGDVSSL